MIDWAWRCGKRDDMWDLWDSSVIGELKGPDEKLFSEGTSGETQLVWSLSVNWFNLYLNKQAGKLASTGSMVMACLNLPPSLRLQEETSYLVRIIPGPKEPRKDQINHFLRPLIDDLL
jgi:hypothetical protein